MHRWTPYVRHFPEAHTGLAIKLSLDGMIEELGLDVTNILKVAINDNASNCKLAIKLSDYLVQYLCQIHTLQLGVGDTFKSTYVGGANMDEVIKTGRSLANHLVKSGPDSLALKESCNEMKIKYTTVKNPNKTRWNSVHTMLKSIIKVKPALIKLANDDPSGNWEKRVFSSAEWKMAEGAVKILEEVLLVTKAWEAETTPTINLVISELYNLDMKLEETINNSGTCRYLCLS